MKHHHHCDCHGEHDHHHCGCHGEHEHHHEEGNLKSKLIQIAATVILLVVAVFIEKEYDLATWQLLLVYLVPYLLVGHETLAEAAEGIAKGDMFNEDFLMAIATIGALCIGFFPGSETEFPEAVFVMLFFQIGELFEGYAEGKSRDSISHLMNIRPDVANVERNEKVDLVSPEEVEVGEIIVIKPGEKVPLDGVVIEGNSALNTIALTGESMPRDLNEGDHIMSGCVNLTGLIRVRTTKSFGESTVSKIINLVESADQNKSKSEAFITRFARVYTPIVVFAALALAVIPPMLGGMGIASEWLGNGSFGDHFPLWLNRALIFLVVSCPCALVISVPLTFFGGIGGASRNGILIKGSNYMDALAKVGTVVFDKTGTLTHGEFAVEAVHVGDSCSCGSSAGAHHVHVGEYSDQEKILLHLAAHAEHFTNHPIGAALRSAFPDEATDNCVVSDVKEIAGYGIRAQVNGKEVCVGNKKMMASVGAKWHDCSHVGTIIHVAIDGKYVGHIVINDQIKEGSAEAIAQLKALGVGEAMNDGTNYIIKKDGLNANESVSYELRLWIDYDTTEAQAGKEWHGKVVVSAVAETAPATWDDPGEGTLMAELKANNEIGTPATVPGREPSGYTLDDVTDTSTSHTTTTTANYYITYGTGWTANGSTFNLTGTALSSSVYSKFYSNLIGKYLPGGSISASGSPKTVSNTTVSCRQYNTSSSCTAHSSCTWKANSCNGSYIIRKSTVRKKSTTGLNAIYYVVDATSSSLTVKELTSNAGVLENNGASTQDDYGTSYYFRGKVNNNFVEYANMCWRIVRVAGNGAIKMVLYNYNGLTSTNNTPTSSTPCD